MQLQQQKIEYSGFSPSFSCYSSDSMTSTAIAKVIREEEASRFLETGGVGGDDFEFSLVISDEEVSMEEIDSRGLIVFPVFNRDLLVNEVDREIKATDGGIGGSSGVIGSFRKVFIGEREEASSYSLLQGVESEHPPSGSYCVWRPTADGGSSPVITTWKKSRSTGSGSKWWMFRYLLRRINGEGKQPVVLLTPKKVNSPKRKRNSGVHEQFYLQRRAEIEFGKRKSYLPYRKDLVGLFANVNGIGKMIPL